MKYLFFVGFLAGCSPEPIDQAKDRAILPDSIIFDCVRCGHPNVRAVTSWVRIHPLKPRKLKREIRKHSPEIKQAENK